MKYNPILYARSLYEVLKNAKLAEHDPIFKNFWQTVKKNGDQSRAGAIADSFEKLIVKNNGGRMVDIETAREMAPYLSKQLYGLFKQNDLVRKIINPALVAGVRVELDGEMELDYSLARKFRKMFGGKNKI